MLVRSSQSVCVQLHESDVLVRVRLHASVICKMCVRVSLRLHESNVRVSMFVCMR